MATLGQSSSHAFTFTVSSTFGDMAAGPFTMPAGGGVITQISGWVGNNGTSQNGRFYVWQASGSIPGTWLVRGSSTFALGALGLQSQSSLASNTGITGQFIPGGTVIWIGIYCSAGTEQCGANAGSGGGTELGNTSDGNWSDHGAAALGQMEAFITYSPGGVAYVNTGTFAAPVMTQGVVYVNTGTFAAPVWTQANGVFINTGTFAAPVWTPAD